MEKWVPYALMAAVFIAVRDLLSKKIFNKYNYIDYIIIANIIVFIGTLTYILISKKDITTIQIPEWGDLFTIIVRLLIVYFIVEPSIFNSLKFCDNPGYANSIINLNALFLLFLAFIFYKTEFNMKKFIGVIVLLVGTYLIF